MKRPRPGGRERDASLASGEDFQTVYRAGSRYASAVATVYVLAHEGAGVRLGISAGRRLGRAVNRNRVRRRIREAFRRIRPGIDRGADVVVVPRGRAMKASFDEVVQALSGALAGAGMIRKNQSSPHARAVDAAEP